MGYELVVRSLAKWATMLVLQKSCHGLGPHSDFVGIMRDFCHGPAQESS